MRANESYRANDLYIAVDGWPRVSRHWTTYQTVFKFCYTEGGKDESSGVL